MKKLVLLITSITFIGILPSLLQYGYFFMWADFVNQEIPYIIETKRMLTSGSPFWSWNHCIGDNFMACYFFSKLTSPFVWINCLFPYSHVYLGITITLFLKMICLGLSCYYYFRKMSIAKDLSVIGSLMYVFSSFSISNLYYYTFLEPMIALPLLLISIECFLRKEKVSGLYLSGTSFLVCFINFYFAVCSLILAFIYSLFRMFSKDVRIDSKRFLMGMGYVIMGILLSSFIILPTLYYLKDSPRNGVNWRLLMCFDNYVYWPFERLRTLFMPKLVEGENSFFYGTGYFSNAANIPVLGMLFVLFYVFRFKGWLKWLIVTLLLFYLTPMNGVFLLFTDPYYSRWAYGLTLFLILASLKYIGDGGSFQRKHLVGYVFLSIIIALTAYGSGYRMNTKYGWEMLTDDNVVNIFIIAVFFINLFILFLYYKHQNNRMLLSCVVAMSCIHLSLRVAMGTDFFYNDLLGKNVRSYICSFLQNKELKRNTNESFLYRTDLTDFHLNTPLLKNTPAMQSFSSMHNPIVNRLFRSVDENFREGSHTVRVKSNVMSYDALMSVRKIVIPRDSLNQRFAQRSLGNKMEECEDVVCYENRHYIPMGFTYDTYIDESIIDSLNALKPKEDVPIQLLANLAVKRENIAVAKKYLREGKLQKDLLLDSLVSERKKNVCSSFVGDTKGFKATVHMDRDNLLFFSVPSDKGFIAYVDGIKKPIYSVNLGLSAIVVAKGHHNINFKYYPQGLKEGVLLSLFSLITLLLMYWKDTCVKLK